MHRGAETTLEAISVSGSLYTIETATGAVKKHKKVIRNLRDVFRTNGETYLSDRGGNLYVMKKSAAVLLEYEPESPSCVFVYKKRHFLAYRREIRAWRRKAHEIKEFFAFL